MKYRNSASRTHRISNPEHPPDSANWKATPMELTLANLGVRHDVTLPRTERFDRQELDQTSARSNPFLRMAAALHTTISITGDPVHASALLGGRSYLQVQTIRVLSGIDWKDISAPGLGSLIRRTRR